MFKGSRDSIWLTALVLTILLHGCAATTQLHSQRLTTATAIYRPQTKTPAQQQLLRYSPLFEVEDYQYEYNRIGSPAARITAEGDQRIYIDTTLPTIYTMIQPFSTSSGNYTNFIYRVHFPEVPHGHLTKGRNVGLLIYVTVNEQKEPILITTLHTCGCYLAIIPTSNLVPEKWPANWQKKGQNNYGEKVPGFLELKERVPSARLIIKLRSETHRVMGVEFKEIEQMAGGAALEVPVELTPMSALEQIPLNGGYVSFFEKKGPRKGYVKDSGKPLEKLLMGWWAFDFQVGEDKALGPREETGVTVYTSLKFWARKASNIWDFPVFLKYWGWNF